MATGTIKVYSGEDLLSPPYMDILPKTLTFDVEITSGETIVSFQWDFGDAQSSNYANPTHTYETFGYHYVYLTVTDDSNNVSVITLSDPIILAVLDFEVSPVTGSKPLTVQFTDKSQAPSGTYFNEYAWDFGDTESALNIENPEHTYLEDGSYNVTLTAKLNL